MLSTALQTPNSQCRHDWYFSTWADPPKPALADWADSERVLSLESNPRGGKWRTSFAEFTREPMNCLTDPRYQEVVMQWPAQSGKTEMLMNYIGYIHDQDPGPVLYLIETLDKAKAIVTDRYLPMLRDTPCLRKFRKAGRGKGRATADDGIDSHERLHHSFPGGHFTLVGANSPAGLSTRPIRYLLMDEIDAYPASAGKEGDPVGLATVRTTAYEYNRKIVKISSPRDASTSRIAPAYEASDQRRCFVPCPMCGFYQTLEWDFLRWKRAEATGDVIPQSIGFECMQCGQLIPQRDRYKMLQRCEWRAAYPGRRVAGFFLWAAYSPTVSWESIITEYLAKHNEPEEYKVYLNTVRAETWKPKGESAEHLDVMLKAEERQMYEIPTEAVFLTAGVDVQKDRLECSIYAWGVGEQGWLIGHAVVFGQIGDEQTERDLDAILTGSWKDDNGRALQITRVSMDSGFRTNEVYNYIRGRSGILATKGVAKKDAPSHGRPTLQDVNYLGQTIKDGIQLWPIGTHVIKEAMMIRLQKQGSGPKTLHFPAGLSEEFYLQLTAERLETFTRGGQRAQRWALKRPRNEAWDCLVLAYHAALIAGVQSITKPPEPQAQPAAKPTQPKPAGLMAGLPRGMIQQGTMSRLLGRERGTNV